MANVDHINVIAKDKHSVNLYNGATGNFLRNVYITSGEIIGQPVNTGKLCTITCLEGGRALVVVYELPQFRLKNKYNP